MALSEVTWLNLRLWKPVTFLKWVLAAVFMSVWTRGGRLGGLMIYQSVYISMVPKPIRGVPAQTRVFHSVLPHHYWINQRHWGWIYLWGRKWEVIWYTWPGASFTAAANKCGGGCRSLPVDSAGQERTGHTADKLISSCAETHARNMAWTRGDWSRKRLTIMGFFGFFSRLKLSLSPTFHFALGSCLMKTFL